ncbi:MAG: hypothetical protein ACE5OZ_00450 [Candidatus Heimdallarchaeota archaeon]
MNPTAKSRMSDLTNDCRKVTALSAYITRRVYTDNSIRLEKPKLWIDRYPNKGFTQGLDDDEEESWNAFLSNLKNDRIIANYNISRTVSWVQEKDITAPYRWRPVAYKFGFSVWLTPETTILYALKYLEELEGLTDEILVLLESLRKEIAELDLLAQHIKKFPVKHRFFYAIDENGLYTEDLLDQLQRFIKKIRNEILIHRSIASPKDLHQRKDV